MSLSKKGSFCQEEDLSGNEDRARLALAVVKGATNLQNHVLSARQIKGTNRVLQHFSLGGAHENGFVVVLALLAVRVAPALCCRRLQRVAVLVPLKLPNTTSTPSELTMRLSECKRTCQLCLGVI